MHDVIKENMKNYDLWLVKQKTNEIKISRFQETKINVTSFINNLKYFQIDFNFNLFN